MSKGDNKTKLYHYIAGFSNSDMGNFSLNTCVEGTLSYTFELFDDLKVLINILETREYETNDEFYRNLVEMADGIDDEEMDVIITILEKCKLGWEEPIEYFYNLNLSEEEARYLIMDLNMIVVGFMGDYYEIYE